MNTFQSCRNTSDAIPLYLPQNLYLKPIARIHISVQLPSKIEPGKSISNWEIMEKLRVLIRPEEFSTLKVAKSTLEFIRFEAELEDKSKLFKVIALLDARTIKINAFKHDIKVRASEAKLDFPTRHSWDQFFRDAKNMDEMKPGERPDTIHIANLPIKWFVPVQHMHKDDVKPSNKIFHRVFEKFGNIRYVDIPICDPYRSKMKEHMTGMKTFTFDQDTFFEGYVQFKDYVGFTRAMDAFRGMKLLRKESATEAETVNIKIDFDKTKHLSEATIRRRQIVRERLIAKEKDKEEKEKQEKIQINKAEDEKRRKEVEQKEEKERRRREREERRKARHFAQLKLNETEELQKKIAKEEKKLIKAQRKLEAIRLIEALFDRIKAKREKDEENCTNNHNSEDELTKYKKSREKKLKDQRDKLNKALEGHVVLNSILGKDNLKDFSSESSSNSESDSSKKAKKKKHKKKRKKLKSGKEREKSEEKAMTVLPDFVNPYMDLNWFTPSGEMYPYPPMFAPVRGFPPSYAPPMMRGRGMNGNPGTSRGTFPRRRGTYNPYWKRGWRGRRGSVLPTFPPEMEHQYYKYFSKFLEENHDDRNRKSYSRSRSRSSSYKRSRRNSYSCRSRRRSRSSSSSRSRSRSRNRSRSKSKSRSKSYSRKKSRSKSKTRSRRDKSRSKTKSRSRSRKRSTRDNSRSPSYRSIDSSKFISPSRLRSKRSRSKSWSLPRSTDKKKRSWSKSPKNSKV